VNNFLNQLQLTPKERRVVVVVFLVVIVVLNFLFVWPHFGEWGSLNRQLADMNEQIEKHNRTILLDINPTNGWRKAVDKLASKERKEGGSADALPPVDPQVQLQNTIRQQERKTGVTVENYGQGSVKTNDAFFEEHSTAITVESQEPQLVNFLYNMGNDPAMIRVAKLDLKPADNNRYKLKVLVTLTANYKKKPPQAASPASTGAKPTRVAAKPPAGAVKPAAAGPKPTGPPAPGQTPKRAPGGPPAPVQTTRRAPGGPPAPGGPTPPSNRPRRTPAPAPGQP
jgi:hypothetical protein